MTMRMLTATVKSAGDDGNGSFEAIASAPTVDRDGEVIAARAFNPLPARIPIHVDHVMNSEGLVGTGRPYYDGDLLKVHGTFAGTPKAQMVRQLVIEGHMSTMSVGFLGAQVDKQGAVPLITKGELIEVSFVSVPSNRQALVTSARSFRGQPRSPQWAATRALMDLALLDAELVLAELEHSPKGLGGSADRGRSAPPVDARTALREAQQLLAQLNGRNVR
jgi:HK97 family phage prohead protease